MVKAKMFVGKQNECIALQRKIAPPAFKPNMNTFATQTQPTANSPGSWKELKQLNHDISAGTQVAYKIHLLSKDETGSVLFVPKPNGKLRFCVDFRHLNSRTAMNRAPIPLQGELLDNLHGSNVFSAPDLASGFYPIAMASDSKL